MNKQTFKQQIVVFLSTKVPKTLTTLLNSKQRQLLPAHVSHRFGAMHRGWGFYKHNLDLITFAQHSSLHHLFRMGGTVSWLSACCLLFFLVFTSSHVTLSVVHILPFLLCKRFSPSPISHGGEWLSMKIIYLIEVFLKGKRKIYFSWRVFGHLKTQF
jgi:hypothetical protein